MNNFQRFKAMVERFPWAIQYFDFEKREYNWIKVQEGLAYLSSGQEKLLRFFLSVWRRDGKYHFDFCDSIFVMDKEARKTVVEWASDPFWP